MRCGSRQGLVVAICAVGILAPLASVLGASRTFTFEEPEFGVPDAACDTAPKTPFFSRPGISGTTSSLVEASAVCGQGALGGTFGNDTLLTAQFSASPGNSAELRFSWLDPANDNSWVRVATSGAGVYPNAGVYLGVGGKISMKIAVFGLDAAGNENPAGQLEFCPMARENGALVPIGTNGGSSGSIIEFLGIESKGGSASPVGGARLTHSPTRQFHALEWLIISDTEIQVTVDGVSTIKKVLSFNLGNGKLDAANSRGTIDALGIHKPADDDVTKKWFVNVDDVKIEALGVTDPIAIKTPVLWTDTTVTVVNVNPQATELRLYKNDTLVQTANPAAPAPSEFTFTGITLAIGDVLTATQVVDGIESVKSTSVTVLPPGIRVAMCVREIASVSNPQVGGNGGTTPAVLEWVGDSLNTSGTPGGQLVRMSPCWQTVTIDPAASTTKVRTFSGGNGALNGPAAPWYALEHLALTIDTANPFPGPFTIYIDSIENDGVVFGNFDSYTAPAANGTVMFRQPSFSGSTDDFLQGFGTVITPNISQVVKDVSDSGPNSLKLQFQFISTSTANWLRLTTSSTANQPNPLVRLDKPVTFRMLIVPTTGLGTGPIITSPPKPYAALLGDMAVFTVGATGTGTLHYQWLRDGKPIGTDSPTLTLTDLKATDAGQISVTICDETAPIHSDAVALTVLPCPTPFADVNRDSDVDQEDFAFFQLCYTGPDQGFGTITIGPGCKCLNRDGDFDIDQDDYTAFSRCVTGAQVSFASGSYPDCVP